MAGKVTFLLDGNQTAHQFFHMARGKTKRETGDPDAMPDLADVLEWFLTRLDNLRDYMRAHHSEVTLVIIYDGHRGKNFRNCILPEYKENRKGVRIPEVYEAVADSQEALVNSDEWIPLVSPEGYEADDLMASICHQETGPVIMHSSDKDMNQCLEAGRVSIFKRSEMVDGAVNDFGIPIDTVLEVKEFSVLDFESEFGFPVGRFVDYQALVGDAADNVVGADRIGPKKAKEIIQAYPGTAFDQIETGELFEACRFNKPQRAGWPAFLVRLSKLQRVLTLETNLSYPLLEIPNAFDC
jgi:DNA polymerase-1